VRKERSLAWCGYYFPRDSYSVEEHSFQIIFGQEETMDRYSGQSRKSHSPLHCTTTEDLDFIRRTPVDLNDSPLVIKQMTKLSPISVADLVDPATHRSDMSGSHQKNSKLTRTLLKTPSFGDHGDDQPYYGISTPIARNKAKCRHAVVMGDTGAEVTFLERTPEETRQPLRTQRSEDPISPLKERLESIPSPIPRSRSPGPAAERDDIPSVSLLDGEVPNNGTPVAPFGGCCSTQVVCCRPDSIMTPTLNMQTVENRIALFLASPVGLEDWCSGWQAWNYFEAGPRVEFQHSTKLKEDVKRVLRNRASNVKSKERRMTKLKTELNPFLATPEPKAVKLTRVNSYQVDDRTNGRKHLGDRTNSNPIVSMEKVWESMTSCTAPPKGDDANSPLVIRTRGMCSPEEEDLLCYDSDPEETTRRRSDWDRKSTFLQPSDGRGTKLQYGRRRNVSRDIKDCVQQFINQTFTLIWHPNTGGDYRKSASPLAVKAWIERGHRLDRKGLVQPKFCWQKTANAAMATGTDPNEVFRTDILDITRILEVNRVDRRFYPFAQRRKSLLIQCMDDKMLFQAATVADRDAMVHGMKMVVARLGSLIIVQDEALFEEFFAFDGSNGPGDLPQLG